MGSLADDHDSAIKLIIEEYHKLNTHNPQHELLGFITNVTDRGFENVKDKYEEFLDRFETPKDKELNYVKVAKVLTSYFFALRNAVDEIEGIDRFPKPKQLIKDTPVESLDDLHF